MIKLRAELDMTDIDLSMIPGMSFSSGQKIVSILESACFLISLQLKQYKENL